MRIFASLFTLFFASFAFAAGSVSVTRTVKAYGVEGKNKVEEVLVAWTADASDGSVPNTSLSLHGFVQKIITNPGSTAPTANYDIALYDPEDSALDALSTALQNRHTTTTEQVYPRIAGTPGTVSAYPVFLEPGTYTLAITGNSVNSATGRILFYVTDQP